MASGLLYNLAKMNTATTGTGTITLSTAVSGFLTFALSGVTNGQTVTYIIEDGANRELGYGVYTSSGTTLTRNVLKSTNSDAAINLSGSATVGITAARENFLEWFANIDANGFSIGFDDNTGINDDSGNEVVRFRKTSSAVNYVEILNTATGTGPSVKAVGDDTNVDLNLEAKGTGRVRVTNATLTTPALGTPASGTLTNCTSLPVSTGIGGLGTGIATALAVNTGSAGAPVLFNGAGGTPSSLTLTNATGLPTAGIVDDAVTNAKLANVSTSTLKGRLTASTGDPEDLTLGNGFSSSGTTLSAVGRRNILFNGCFRFNQRAPATNADDTYAHDRWNILTQTGTVAVTSQTLVEDGTPNMMRITQSQASAQRFGFEQIMESSDSYPLRGQAVTLSARVRMSASTTLRYAILEWTGTADTVTSDVVLSWTSGTFTAGNFFLASNLTVTATGSTALTANTLTDVSLTATLGSSVNNVIVLFWTDSTQAQNVTLDVGRAQLELGSVATSFERRSAAFEETACLRYYQIVAADDNLGSSNSTSSAFMQAGFLGIMRTTPNLALSGGGSTITINFFGVGNSTTTSYTLAATRKGLTINANTLSPTRTAFIPVNSATAITCDAEL
ncbi:MAG: hypothetical protein BVN33_14610 [Proteobacteria bacterium ST_bin13]|nr:MAG: hypothetical protein BVN33_14610 [Proteobacteria bacterium ST_bin13]